MVADENSRPIENIVAIEPAATKPKRAPKKAKEPSEPKKPRGRPPKDKSAAGKPIVLTPA